MQRVAQDWLVLQLTGGSGSALGITTGLQFLPVLLLSPYAGVIADRFPKRRLLQVTQAVMAGASLVLGLITVLGVVEVWHVYLLAFVFGIGSAFDAPARQSFVSELVDQDDVTNAVGLNSAAFNLARILVEDPEYHSDFATFRASVLALLDGSLLPSAGIERLRLLGPATDELRAACHAHDVAIDETAVTDDGRIELACWLREQAISRTRHRHGRLDERDR
jgi:hypothetical protein